VRDIAAMQKGVSTLRQMNPPRKLWLLVVESFCRSLAINGGAIIDHKAPRERRFVAVEK
jgi:hypothetical protein